MIKSRAAYLCNVKLLLIVLVVLGHSLEQVGGQDGLLYRGRLPLSHAAVCLCVGLHLKSAEACRKQAKTAALLYLPIQSAVVLAGALGGQSLSLLTPWWHLWYLLSLCGWSLLALPCRRLLERFPRGGMLLCPACGPGGAAVGGAALGAGPFPVPHGGDFSPMCCWACCVRFAFRTAPGRAPARGRRAAFGG